MLYYFARPDKHLYGVYKHIQTYTTSIQEFHFEELIKKHNGILLHNYPRIYTTFDFKGIKFKTEEDLLIFKLKFNWHI